MPAVIVPSNERKFGSGPTARTTPTFISTNVTSPPSTLSITVPSGAQIGDYFIVCLNGNFSINSSSATGLSSTYSGAANSGIGITIYQVINTSASGQTITVTISGATTVGYYFLLTNPNNTNISSYHPSGSTLIGLGGTGVTSYTDRVWPTPPRYNSSVGSALSYDQPAGSIRIRAYAYSASGSDTIGTPSGPGTIYINKDGYYTVGMVLILYTDASFKSSSTFTCSTATNISSIDVGII